MTMTVPTGPYLSQEAMAEFDTMTTTRLKGKLVSYGRLPWVKLKRNLEARGCQIVRTSGGPDYRELVFRDPSGKGHRLKMLVHDSVQICVMVDGKSDFGYADDCLEELLYQAMLISCSCS